MVHFKLIKKIDIGNLGLIYLFTFSNKEHGYDKKFFCVYFPADINNYESTIKCFEREIFRNGLVSNEGIVYDILLEYINNTSKNIGNDTSSVRIYDDSGLAIFSVFEKLYKKGKFKEDNNDRLLENKTF